MAINAVSHVSYHNFEPIQTVTDTRLLAEANEGTGYMSTASKVGTLIIGIIASFGSFIIMGPLVGIVVSLLSGIAALWTFNSASSDPHEHPRQHNLPQTIVPLPLNQPHVPVGRHSAQPHVQVGGGHVNPVPPRPWYERVFSFIPTNTLFMNNQGTGRGGGGQTYVPHINVGHGHFQPASSTSGNAFHGNPVTQLAPPSGPSGHVQVGQGRHGN